MPQLSENRSEYKVGIYLYDKSGKQERTKPPKHGDRVKPDDIIIRVRGGTTGSWVSYPVWHDRLPEPYFRTGIKEEKVTLLLLTVPNMAGRTRISRRPIALIISILSNTYIKCGGYLS